MAHHKNMSRTSPDLSEQLLLAVLEELKLPLLQIAHKSDHGQLTGQPDLPGIKTAAETALKLADSYAFGLHLSLNPQSLDIEPVSVASVLYDTGQQLHNIAKQYGVGLELNVAGRFSPVMAHRQGLQSALVSIGTSLIEALPALEQPQLRLQLATHRSRYGIVAGLYSDTEQLSRQTLHRGRRLLGRSRQPLHQLTHTSGAGIFVADTILRAMNLQLTTSRHHRLYGLGTVLQPNHQLHLV